MAILKLILDTRRMKSDSTYPIVFSISVNGDTRYIPTKHAVLEKDWNSKTDCLKKIHPAYDVLTDRLNELRVKYLSRIIDYEKHHSEHVSVNELKDYLVAVPKLKVIVSEFWSTEVKYLYKAGRTGSAVIYENTLIALKKVGNLDIPFNQVTHKLLRDMEASMISNGIKTNSIAIYYRTFRAIYNKAIIAKEVSYDLYPFRTFKIKKAVTRPRVLTAEELQKYFITVVEKSSWLYESWLMGKLMFMLIGINFKDLVLLSEQQIQHGRVIFNRSKTGRQYSIQLLPEAQEILEYFKGRAERTLLGKIRDKNLDDKNQLYPLIKQANKVFNKHIGIIGKELGIMEKLTGYCFRYTWANLAKQQGFSKDLISEALGHSYGLRVTGIYLESFDLAHIDAMNKTVCETVMNKAQEQ